MTGAPIFDDHGMSFHADACSPLVSAVERQQLEMCALARGHYPGRALPRGSLHGLKSVGYWDATKDQDWGLDWHRNEGIEICFVESGQIGFGVDGKELELAPNTLTVTSPWQLHRVGLPQIAAGRLNWLILDVGVRRPNQPWRWPNWIILAPQDVAELGNRLRQNEHPAWPAPNLRDCFRSISLLLSAEPQDAIVSRLAILVNELLLLLLEVMRDGPQKLDETFSESHRTVELFLRDLSQSGIAAGREWTVGSMAAACGLGVTQFVKYCQAITNSTPARYLNKCRLEIATRRLRENPTLGVTQIALEVGFSSSQYFATAFHKYFGCSPSEFRNRRG